MTILEASSVTNLGRAFYTKDLYCTFREFRHFTGIVNLENWAFYRARLYALELPPNIRSLGQNCLRTNPLTKLVLPSSIKSIGKDALMEFSGALYVYAPTAPSLDDQALGWRNHLYLPVGASGYETGAWKTYFLDAGWKYHYTL